MTTAAILWRRSGLVAEHGREVDEGVAGLGGLGDGDAPPLLDEARHCTQLLWADGDELPPVVNHTWGAGTFKNMLWVPDWTAR